MLIVKYQQEQLQWILAVSSIAAVCFVGTT